ncbi:MAG: VOC family protein [Cyanobacteria bacterium J06639_1]
MQEWSCLAIDYVQFYVDDVEHWRRVYLDTWQFSERSRWQTDDTLHVWVSHADIHLLLSQALSACSPVARFRRQRARGVAEIGLRVDRLDGAISHLRDRLNFKCSSFKHPKLDRSKLDRPNFERWPDWNDGRDRGIRIQTPFGIRHALIERSPSSQPDDALLPGTPAARSPASLSPEVSLTHIDHAVLNVGRDRLQTAARWYAEVLGLEPLDRFDIHTPYSGLRSVVMGCRDRGLQLPINEPTHARSQVQEFLEANGGSGIQHIALHASDIERTVGTLRDRGVEFLAIPSSYYDRMAANPLLRDRVERLRPIHLLADLEPPDRLLLQTFARPLFGEPTFFYEIVQRQQRAVGFGEGNFQALYEAIEREQQHRAAHLTGNST